MRLRLDWKRLSAASLAIAATLLGGGCANVFGLNSETSRARTRGHPGTVLTWRADGSIEAAAPNQTPIPFLDFDQQSMTLGGEPLDGAALSGHGVTMGHQNSLAAIRGLSAEFFEPVVLDDGTPVALLKTLEFDVYEGSKADLLSAEVETADTIMSQVEAVSEDRRAIALEGLQTLRRGLELLQEAGIEAATRLLTGGIGSPFSSPSDSEE